MKDIYKNPILYYIAVPVIVGLWPLLVWAIYLPNAQKDIGEQIAQYEQARQVMDKILTLEPDRLEFADANDTSGDFTYREAINMIANRCGIPPSKCNINTSMPITNSSGQKSQSASVDLKEIKIGQFARFLSMMQLRWSNLQCERLKLSKKQNHPDNDMWDIDIELKYYY